ncbi:protein sneaky isoform X4 [Diabrotica undecimpunctata]|uniref:protein sneaky isoform X4 n=1 Tax=Diabrotica undecimpunctata TaxID=50387 RepID=UPI003B632545
MSKFFKRCKKFVPLFNRLFCSEKYENVGFKRLFGFIFGFFLGILFYKFILVDLDFTEDSAIIVGGIICLMLAFGYAFSSQIRCITCLTFPIFGGKAGRGVLKALVIAFVISGPIENIGNNGKEVVRVFACTAALTYNMTKTRFELMFKPFTQAIFGMKADMNEVKDTLRSIKDVSAPITGEIEDDREMRKMKEENDYLDVKLGDTKRSQTIDEKYKTKGEQVEAERYEKMYMEKIELRCENQFTKAANKCRQMFANAYDTCYDTVTWLAAWLLCWPMKLDFICNIAEALGGNKRCDPRKDMDPGTGMIASLLRSLVKGFNVKKRIRIERTNEKCLPRPHLLLNYYLYKIYGTYLAVVIMMFLQAYCLRLRRVLCSYFYRKREKKRVLYLYNETLKRRKGFFRFMRKKIRRMVREHRLKEDFTGIQILRINHPKACDWLRIFTFARRKCLICKEPEPRKTNSSHEFVECPNEFCHFIYCRECWIDMGNVCLACQTETEETTSGFEDNDTDEDTDF